MNKQSSTPTTNPQSGNVIKGGVQVVTPETPAAPTTTSTTWGTASPSSSPSASPSPSSSPSSSPSQSPSPSSSEE